MDGALFFDALLKAKPGTAITKKVSRSGAANKPGVMTIGFSDGMEVSFPRRDALSLKTEDQLAAFVAKLLQ